jgi:hypothetical protein
MVRLNKSKYRASDPNLGARQSSFRDFQCEERHVEYCRVSSLRLYEKIEVVGKVKNALRTVARRYHVTVP